MKSLSLSLFVYKSRPKYYGDIFYLFSFYSIKKNAYIPNSTDFGLEIDVEYMGFSCTFHQLF